MCVCVCVCVCVCMKLSFGDLNFGSFPPTPSQAFIFVE